MMMLLPARCSLLSAVSLVAINALGAPTKNYAMRATYENGNENQK